MAETMGADLLDVDAALARSGRLGWLIHRVGGRFMLLAWTCFRQLGRYDAIVSDGEQVGLPLALLARLRRPTRTAHVMIVHIISVPKKRWLYRLFGLGRRIDAMIVYSSWQQRFIRERLGFPAVRVVLSPYTVDTAFFAPRQPAEPSGARPVVATAGLERRDYPTLIEAARGLGARVIIAAASPWYKRADTTEGADLPP